MTENYLRHPAYAEYPVVGVSWIQAMEYSKWRTDRVNEIMLEREGYVAKGAPYNAKAGETFNTETYLTASTIAFGGKDTITCGVMEIYRITLISTNKPYI